MKNTLIINIIQKNHVADFLCLKYANTFNADLVRYIFLYQHVLVFVVLHTGCQY